VSLLHRVCLVAAASIVVAAGCGEQPNTIPDPGFVYLSREDVAAAVRALAEPLSPADSCTCELWGAQAVEAFTSPVVPGATLSIAGDSACAGQTVRKRGAVRIAAARPGDSRPCVALDLVRDSLIVVSAEGSKTEVAQRYLQASLLFIVAWAPDLLSDLAVITSTTDVLAVMRGKADTLASSLDRRMWLPEDQSDFWRDSLTQAAGSAAPPWVSTTGDPVKLIFYTVHHARDGKYQYAPFMFEYRHGRLQYFESIFDPDYEQAPPEFLQEQMQEQELREQQLQGQQQRRRP
jgi:hypothetical protein